MITHEGQVTKIQFGSNGTGSVGLLGFLDDNFDGVLSIRQLAVEAHIGENITGKDSCIELPRVELNFTEVESIDSMITVLKHIKSKMETPYASYVYAC